MDWAQVLVMGYFAGVLIEIGIVLTTVLERCDDADDDFEQWEQWVIHAVAVTVMGLLWPMLVVMQIKRLVR